MNTKHIKIITAVMSMALVGLVALQFFWIRHALEIRESRFRDNVNLALTEFSTELRGEEIKHEIRVSARKWQSEKDSERKIKLIQIEENPTKFDSLKIISKILIIDSSENIHGGIREWNENQNTEELFEFTEASEFSGIKTEDLLDKLLKNHGVDINYEAVFLSGDSHQQFFPDTFEKGNNITFIRTLKTDGMDHPETLTLKFTDPKRVVLDSLKLILPTSGLIILVITLCFGLTLAALFRMKKLSDMKSDFINNMTHELKTPISTISLASEALLDPQLERNPQRVKHFAGVIQEENFRLKRQVERVLEMARIDRGELNLHKENIILDDLIRSESERIRSVIEERGGKLSLYLKAEHAELWADPIHLAGIFANLLDNANKYSPETPEIEVRTYLSLENFIVEFQDHGTGINKDAQKRIFDKFYRVPTGNRHDVKGFGLGLSYAKAMCEAHGGQISVTSEPGNGSTFKLEFPRERS